MQVAQNPTTDKEREWKWEVEQAVTTLTGAKELESNPKLMAAARQMIAERAQALTALLADAGRGNAGKSLMNM